MSIPPKHRFVIGHSGMPGTSGNKLEIIRPDALLTSLMIYPPDAKTDLALRWRPTLNGAFVYLCWLFGTIRRNLRSLAKSISTTGPWEFRGKRLSTLPAALSAMRGILTGKVMMECLFRLELTSSVRRKTTKSSCV